MSIRREGRGRRATLTARVATACAAVAALVAVAAPSASAYVPCPTQPIPVGSIEAWSTKWPTPGANPKGVTLCQAMVGPHGVGYLTIIDLRDGAKMRLHTDRVGPTVPWSRPDTEFNKKTAEEWYSHLRASTTAPYNVPAPSRLFSTTNASFFTNAVNGTPTRLPFPQKSWNEYNTTGLAMIDAGTDPGSPHYRDHHAPKRDLQLRWSSLRPDERQIVEVSPFPTYYDRYEVATQLTRTDALVGLDPTYEVGEAGAAARRNYVGVLDKTAYIFTSTQEYTAAQANDIMQQIQPGMYVIQLDGGGSAQMFSGYGEIDSSIPVLNRQVPDTIAIYTAP